MIGLRKTMVCFLYLILSMVALKMGLVEGSDWLKYTTAILAAFFGANMFDGAKK